MTADIILTFKKGGNFKISVSVPDGTLDRLAQTDTLESVRVDFTDLRPVATFTKTWGVA